MANISVRKETNKLYFDFRYRGLRCREQTNLNDTPANRKKMEAVLKKIEAAITLNSFEYQDYFPNSSMVAKFNVRDTKPSNMKHPTIEEFARQWMTEMQPVWRKSYASSVRFIMNGHILPKFGEALISHINKADILSFRASLAKVQPGKNKPRAPSTINKTLKIFRLMMNEAADRFQFNSPFIGVALLKEPKTHIQPFTLEEVDLILKTVRPDFRNYFKLRFFSGLRSGEINGLRWKNVDFERMQILVRETFSSGEVAYTKTDGSQREIDITAPILDALNAQMGHTSHLEYVFSNRKGEPLDNHNVCNRVWYPLLRHLDLTKRRLYQTRHTAATFWLAAGENPEWIARQMGHTSTEMLFTIYSRYVPNLTRRDGSAFEKMLASTKFSQALSDSHNSAEINLSQVRKVMTKNLESKPVISESHFDRTDTQNSNDEVQS